MNKISKKHKISDIIKEFKKKLHECLKNGNCIIIDRGLAICNLTNNYCDMSMCPNLFKEDDVSI